ncbi:PUA domain-containing protein, partial [Burkholderia pseudomallei]|uniref:PUA domain-containing protein n=1 Tax=Burkholderia pseudomallei TaxID=28450 RepID=UPI003CFB071C
DKLTEGGNGLLPVGVVAGQGAFGRGEVIACVDDTGREVPRGVSNYSSAETKLIQREPSGEIETVLGYMLEPELIHRDNLVVV